MILRFCGLLLFLACLQARELSLEEKTGQLILTYIEGETLNDSWRQLVEEGKIGGVIYYQWANALTDPRAIRQLSQDLQSAAKESGLPKLFITVDQEGGAVSRLSHGFTDFPGNAAQARCGDPSIARKVARAIGEELATVGINLNFAPVVDVKSNPQNPIIGIRSFGSKAEAVIQYGREALKGYQDSGTVAVLKHFPGHGDTSIDSHLGLPVSDKSLEELFATELLPFKALASETAAIMSAHILFPRIDPQSPATLSPFFLQSLLRETIGFQGLLISDSLTMAAVLDSAGSLAEAAIRSIQAGCDLIVIGGATLEQGASSRHLSEIRLLHQALVDAVRDGRISEQRLEESLCRIHAVKEVLSEPSQNLESLCSPGHIELAEGIAKQAFCVEKMRFLPEGNGIALAPLELQERLQNCPIPVLFFDSDAPNHAEELLAFLSFFDWTLFFSSNAWKDPFQETLLLEAVQIKPLVHAALKDPQDLALTEQSCASVATFSPDRHSIQKVFHFLKS